MNVSSVPRVSIAGAGNVKKRKKNSVLKNALEFLAFIAWLGLTGYGGYYFGYDPASICPITADLQASNQVLTINQPNEAVEEIIEEVEDEEPCPVVTTTTTKATPKKTNKIDSNLPTGTDIPLFKEDGYTLDELKASWECSHAIGEDESKVVDHIFSDKELKMEKTKWKSIITVEPKAFFDKFLTQYPGDTRATQPVVIFSHKPLQSFEELTDVCKVIDIAIVPDRPGTCVAVTETYHDVASYHMLHADRLENGDFGLTSNFVDGRTLPTEAHYALARSLYLEYFRYNEDVQEIVRQGVPKYTKGKVTVGVLVEDNQDIELFLNSYASAQANPGINRNKFVLFTTSTTVKSHPALLATKIKILYFPFLQFLGTNHPSTELALTPEMRSTFLTSWFSFACANQLIKMLWQSVGTIWYERPDDIVNTLPAVETQWAFAGRSDSRSAPYFISMDFFIIAPNERPVHLLHELILHFDLLLAWQSFDAVAAYRLIENNSR